MPNSAGALLLVHFGALVDLSYCFAFDSYYGAYVVLHFVRSGFGC